MFTFHQNRTKTERKSNFLTLLSIPFYQTLVDNVYLTV